MVRDIVEHPISELFREKVVAKCGGLPLAAATLDGLLRFRRLDAWDALLNSNILADLPQQSDIHPVLRLSYHYLPFHLKRCFAYCAIFPKDYEFTEREVVLLWMAEGIIQQSRKDKELEDWGSECFHDLVSRSIFQPSSSDSSKFVMHNLVRDLAQLISRQIIFNLDEANRSSRRLERVRHSSHSRGWFEGKDKFEFLYEVKHLRTFLPIYARGGADYRFIRAAVPYYLLPKLRKLRVLSLQHYYVTELPNSIADLRLLRCLNLAGTAIESLPESTSSMLNLEILILKDCTSLRKLPTKMRKLINLRHLDIEGANLLTEMPWGMKELKNLRKLSNFIVGDCGSRLKDLKNLKFLRGELCISGLHNVHDSQDAREAMLCEKQNLKALSLQWGTQYQKDFNKRMMSSYSSLFMSQIVISRAEEVEENVLDMLQPQKDLKELTISRYGGVRFPSWGWRWFKFENCENCTSLPALGLLSSLKHLVVKGLKKLKSIGAEFYGVSGSNPFQSLVTLCFEDLPEWEYWDTKLEKNGAVAGFSSLCELSIVECPKFSGKLPEHLPSLEKLLVSKCGELVVSFSSLPKLCKLEVEGCKGLECGTPIDLKSIESMTISNNSLQINGCKGITSNDCPVAESKSPPNSVTVISNLLEFGKFLNQGFQLVEALWIGDSQQIKSLGDCPQQQFRKPEQGLHVITFPEAVSIEESCESLVLFPDIKFFHNNLRSLKIGKARALKSLAMMGNSSQLESLVISNCDPLTFVASRKLPSSLKRLEIENCMNLQHLVDSEEDSFTSSSSSSSVALKHLSIKLCPELISLSSGIQLLEALEELQVSGCQKLETIPDSLHNLKSLCIDGCPSLVSLGERRLPESISSVEIRRCEKLGALPSDMHKLNSLQDLDIRECPCIVSFPEEAFPTNLTSLAIGGDMKMLYKGLVQWGLHRLTSIIWLLIERCDESECFPDGMMGMTLPTSLVHLNIVEIQKLKNLSSSSLGFQSLTSLRRLSIQDCPNLTSFPNVGLPSSLLDLSIFNCPNLTSLPKVGLPSSLLELTIFDCPKLRKECKRDKGKEWSKIANIPMFLIDDTDSEKE
ncbi:putative disease resistance protein [Citrus sinensis]|nr:putative disease resistance protein [Citrus sinensis]